MVEISQESEAEPQGGQSHHEFLIGTKGRADRAAEKQFGHGLEVDEVPAEIQGDGIDPDPDEGHGPGLELPHIHHLVEGRQQQVAVASGHQHE